VKEPRLTSRRRFFLVGLGVGIPAAVWPLRPWGALVQIEGSASPHARLSGLLEHPASARVIGREYLRQARGRPTPRALVESIVTDLPDGARTLRSASDRELRRLLTLRTRRDFEEDRTVALQGWIVSLTEARLFALATLA
jgi:hypothetical protein